MMPSTSARAVASDQMSSLASAKALYGRVAVVSGAGGDIGKALAVALAREGAALHLIGRDPRKLELVSRAVREQTTDVLTHRVDLTSDGEIHALRDRLAETSGRVDIVIHAMGAYGRGPHASASARDFDVQYQANVRAPFVLTQTLLPMLREQRGQVVFVNSSAALQARAGHGQYAATKHALKALADSLREEVNADGVRVISVYLGRTAGTRQASIFELEGRPYRPELLLQPRDVAEMVVAALRLADTAEVTDISIRPMRKSY
jgi:NADP-dependent 3-hydroxy acid dehydrogenase YdfG